MSAPTVDRPIATPPPHLSHRCVSCGSEIDGPFCAECGERRVSDRRYSVVQLLHEAFESLTNADGTLVRTLRTLIAKPGELTARYMKGERVRWFGPVRLFLLLNVVYFVWTSVVGSRVFDTPLNVHLRSTAHSPIAERLVTERVADRATTLDAYRPIFDTVATTQAKSLVGLMVPFFALVVALLQLRRRRPFVQHLVFSLHLYGFLLVLLMASDVVLTQPLKWLVYNTSWDPSNQLLDTIVTIPSLVALAVYIGIGLRNAYADGPLAAAVKGLALAYAVGIVLFVYRAILFFTTYWAT